MGKISMIGIWVETILYGMSYDVYIVYLLLILPWLHIQVSSKYGWLQQLQTVLINL